jgi:hypothetical protein
MTRSSMGFFRQFINLCTVMVTALSVFGDVAGESIVVVQGFQTQSEKYAANTVDAYVRAFKGGDRVVTALRPKSQPGWEGGESYTDSAAMLGQISSAAKGQVLVLVIVGDADVSGSLRVSETATVSAGKLVEAVSGASRVSIVSAGCNAIATAMGGLLVNTDAVLSGLTAGQVAHTWPGGNRGQYDLFSRYLLEGYYLLSTDAGVSGSTGELLGRAFQAAGQKTRQTSGGKQLPTATGVQAGDSGAGQVTRLRSREYTFTIQESGGSASGYVSNALGLPIAPIRGSVASGTTSFTFEERGRSRSVTVKDAAGVPSVTLDDRGVPFAYASTRALDVVRYGLYDEEGSLVATVEGVLSGSKVSGEVRPLAGEMRLPLTAEVGSGSMLGTATLVGHTYTFGENWTWSTDGPPAKGVVQPVYFDLPAITAVYADASSGDGRVTVSWEVDHSKSADAILMGDLRFLIIRSDGFSGKPTTFEAPAGRRQYVDRPDGEAGNFEYAVGLVLDHRVTTCEDGQSYPLYGPAVGAKAGTPPAKIEPIAQPTPSVVADGSPGTSTESAAEDVEKEKVKKKEEKKKDKREENMPWERVKEDGVGGKIVYGIFGALIVVAIAIALGAGGGGGGNGLPPGDTGGGPVDQ